MGFRFNYSSHSMEIFAKDYRAFVCLVGFLAGFSSSLLKKKIDQHSPAEVQGVLSRLVLLV